MAKRGSIEPVASAELRGGSQLPDADDRRWQPSPKTSRGVHACLAHRSAVPTTDDEEIEEDMTCVKHEDELEESTDTASSCFSMSSSSSSILSPRDQRPPSVEQRPALLEPRR